MSGTAEGRQCEERGTAAERADDLGLRPPPAAAFDHAESHGARSEW